MCIILPAACSNAGRVSVCLLVCLCVTICVLNILVNLSHLLAIFDMYFGDLR